MAVHDKNISFAEEQKQKIAESVKSASQISENVVEEKQVQVQSLEQNKTVTTSTTENSGKKKDVLIGIHVTKEEQNELREMFCSKGFSLATSYRAAMTYLRQDLMDGKAYLTSNGEILRK